MNLKNSMCGSAVSSPIGKASARQKELPFRKRIDAGAVFSPFDAHALLPTDETPDAMQELRV